MFSDFFENIPRAEGYQKICLITKSGANLTTTPGEEAELEEERDIKD